MSLIYANGYDALTGYNSTDLRNYLEAEGWYFTRLQGFVLVAGTFGGSAMLVQHGGGGGGIGENVRPFMEYGPVTNNSVILGARMTYPDVNVVNNPPIRLYQGGTPVLSVSFTDVGRIKATCNGITAFSNVGVVSERGTAYVSMEYFLDDGSFLVKCNGDTVISVASSDNSGVTQIDGFGFYIDSGTYYTIYDDIYIIHTDGVEPNGHLGNVRCRCHLVAADGDVIDMTPVNAATNWEAVTSPVMTKTSYVTTSTPGDYDLYNFQDGSNARIIYGVAVRVGAWQGDATQLRVSTVLKTEDTEFESDDVASQSSQRIYSFNWGLNPNTGIAWTNEEVNLIQAGGKLVSTE